MVFRKCTEKGDCVKPELKIFLGRSDLPYLFYKVSSRDWALGWPNMGIAFRTYAYKSRVTMCWM